MTAIEWTDKTWNVFVGCSKVSEGCRNCYAINQAYRNNAIAQTMPNPGRMRYYDGLTQKTENRVDWTGIVRFVPEALEIPLRWKKPRKVFVNSMSDLFHESVREEHLDQVFAVMALSPQHTYQILTKRPGRMLEYLRSAKTRIRIAAVDLGRASKTEHGAIESCQWDWPLPNAWMGVTIENQKALNERARPLYDLHNMGWLTFYSAEPLLEAVELYLNHERANWVIVGGESGPGARPCDTDWIYSIVEQCKNSDVAVFVKQMGSKLLCECRTPEHPNWDELGPIYRMTGKGTDINEWPERLRVREFPEGERV
jgi:protein gp37